MPANPVRYGAANSPEPVVHELPPLRYDGDVIAIRLEIRRAEDGTWLGRLIFGRADDGSAPATARKNRPMPPGLISEKAPTHATAPGDSTSDGGHTRVGFETTREPAHPPRAITAAKLVPMRQQ